MKIIKMGNLNKYTNTCPYCSCEYEYDDSDVSLNNSLTSTGMYATVTCPCCGHINSVVYNNIKPSYYYPYFDPLTRYTNITPIQCTTNGSEFNPQDKDLTWEDEDENNN